MGEMPLGCASFRTQVNALLRKNLTYQKRNAKTNCRLVCFPFVLCILFTLLQVLVDEELNKAGIKCGCQCVDTNNDGTCEEVCGVQFSNLKQAASCPIPSPPQWPPLLQIPAPLYRAAKTDVLPFTDLPNESCRSTGSCPVTILMTGSNQSLGEIMAGNIFSTSLTSTSSSIMDILANSVLGSDSQPRQDNLLDPAFYKAIPLYYVLWQCPPNSTFSIKCVEGLNLWRNSSSEVNKELYKGYRQGNSEGTINEILAAYDFLNSNHKTFNVSIWYNATYKDKAALGFNLLRIPRSVNLASNAYLQFLKGSSTRVLFEFIKEMPQPARKIRLDIASLIGTLFFSWVVLQLFPVVLSSLVYEKQQKLRIMMKMHGLGDGPYLLITYFYFLLISVLYILVFVLFGSAIGLKFFRLNHYSIQFVFYFIYINLQISLAFLMAAFFSNVRIATVVGYICVFGTGLLGGFLFQNFIEDSSFPRGWIIVLELYPGFSLYRGLYEFGQYSFTGNLLGTSGMKWKNLNDRINGMKDVLIIMSVEWLLVLFTAYYFDQVFTSGSGKSPLFFLDNFLKRKPLSPQKPSLQMKGSNVSVNVDKPDVRQEREKVEQLLLEPSTSHAIICHDLEKVYKGPDKLAVKGLSLALPRAECFGMLGPNGAGKSSFISMMVGLTKSTSGTTYIKGLDLQTQMDWIYSCMGVCPQHDLLWETLTGREHLLFYGRLKNLKGSTLTQAVEESLRSLNLHNGGVADKQVGKYSGGMKRRLSVVYMDEPSTGLDPASRTNLWNVVKRAKKDRAIILTTHSMEEAEALCDRLGIFVDGSLQCIGNPKELKARYGGSYVLTMTTSAEHEVEVANMVRQLSPNAVKSYHTSGTQKFQIPKHEVRIADVFHGVEIAKSKFPVFAWGLSDATLEDVFIKVANTDRDTP
ncbi:hypothetical protein K2173_019750 [Erythroxylum novogranatense]|uniref:ABC transporter domain-containing protein n=1 Tax=Erythroxylum novogranatense TaxID=1862640 RepID=A0AAV8SM37_9ROSI|nr:hypothetical protein K2173_019750 [Erythroxylum novogranatense]